MIFDRIKSLLKHTAVYGMGDLLGRAVTLLLVPVYARLLTPEQNGVINLAFAFIAFCSVFYSLGLNQALVRHLSRSADPEIQIRRFSSAFWLLLGLGLLLSSLMWTFDQALALLFLDSADFADLFQLIAGIILLDALAEPLFTLCRARQKSVTYAAVRLVQHTLQLGLTMYLIAGLGYGPRAIFWSNGISSAFALLVLLPVGFRHLRLTFSVSTLRELLTFGLPFVPSALAMLVITLSDRFLMKWFLGLESVGVFSVVGKICLPMQLIVRVFRAAWAPAVLSIPDPEESRAVVARVATYFLLGAVFFFLCISAFSRELILLVAGAQAPEYLPGANLIPPVTLAFLASGIYIILTAGVFAEGRARMLPGIVGAGALLNVAINVIFMPHFGMITAAWSTLSAYGLMVVFLHFSVQRFYPVAYEYRRLAKIAFTGTVVFLAVTGYVEDTTAAGLLARILFLLAYPLMLWGWHFFHVGELRDLRSMLRFS